MKQGTAGNHTLFYPSLERSATDVQKARGYLQCKEWTEFGKSKEIQCSEPGGNCVRSLKFWHLSQAEKLSASAAFLFCTSWRGEKPNSKTTKRFLNLKAKNSVPSRGFPLLTDIFSSADGGYRICTGGPLTGRAGGGGRIQ